MIKIIIEGTQGSGKTTMARKISGWLGSQAIEVDVFDGFPVKPRQGLRGVEVKPCEVIIETRTTAE